MSIEDMQRQLRRPSADEEAALDVAELRTRRCLVIAAEILADVTQGTLKGGSMDQLIAIAGIVSATLDSRG